MEKLNEIDWNNIEADTIKYLKKIKIFQRKVQFITGVPEEYSNEKILSEEDCFGKYGVIDKLLQSPSDTKKSTIAVYVTYQNYQNSAFALLAIQSKDISNMNKQEPFFATTKYCKFFLKGKKCKIRNCEFFHKVADTNDCYEFECYNKTKQKQLQTNYSLSVLLQW